jgi:predicted permease
LLPLDGMELVNLPARLGERREGWLGLVGRLAPGVTPVQARAELQAVVARLPVEDTGAKTDRTVVFTPMTDGNPELQSLAPAAYLALGIVSIVLLIACFNVAGLLLARAAERQREISVRSALGAGRWRIVRQFALEGLILATVSGCAAVIVAGWSADLLSVFSLPSPIPQRLHIAIEPRLVGFTAAMVALAGILPALVPAFHATGIDLVRSMRVDTSFGERRSRMRSLFVVAQVAGSTLFIATAVLFLRSFWTTASRDPGFETAHLLVMELKPTDHGYDRPRARLFLDTFVQRLRAHPAVEHAAIADRVSFYVGSPKTTKVSADGTNCAAAPAECRSVFVYGIGTDYFPAVGVPLRSGRELTPREIQVGEGAIASRAMAERLWPQRNAVGEWIREGNEGRQIQIVGVAADVVHHSFGETAREYLYRPLRDDEYGDGVTIVVRTINDARASVSTIQEILRAVDPNIPPRAIKTMAQRMELPLWPIRTGAAFFLICGTLALILATVGLFGTTYLTVSQRTREFGIRAALGATRLRVLRLVVGEGLRLTLPGIALGLGGTVVVARLFARSFFQLESADPAAYAAAGALQTAVAMAACLLPAYRATKTDPMAALRVD